MESFTRPLWGLAPLAAGGGAFEGLDLVLSGLDHGTNPDHPDYWGDVGRHDQRMVEMAGLSQALLLAPETFWTPLPDAVTRAAEAIETGRAAALLERWATLSQARA